MAFGETVYNDNPYSDFETLSRRQANQSLSAGDQAARYADPFMEERKNQIQRLRNIQNDPAGALQGSPFYKFLIDQQLSAVDAKNRATGHSSDFRGNAALQDRAAGVASQAYFPLLQNATQLAMSGSSPTAAGIAYSGGVNRSQDQSQYAALARAQAQQRPPATQPVAPMPMNSGGSFNSGSAVGNMPQSFGMPYGGYDPNYPNGYTPSSQAGTGYVLSDSGASDVSGPGSQYYSYGQGAGQPTQPTQSYTQPSYNDYYDTGNYSDFGGGGDYGE